MNAADLRHLVRDVPDFPRPGVVFKDITPLLGDPAAFGTTVVLLGDRLRTHGAEQILAIESRGFIFGAALAVQLHLPLHLVRKPGKLPRPTVGMSYELEYGTDRLEVHDDVLQRGVRFCIVDDVIATGGTAAAVARLVQDQGGVIACCAFVIELVYLGGRKRLHALPVESLISFT